MKKGNCWLYCKRWNWYIIGFSNGVDVQRCCKKSNDCSCQKTQQAPFCYSIHRIASLYDNCTKLMYLNVRKKVPRGTLIFDGASEGNRTPVSPLARSRSTIELHLHVMAVQTRIELAISSVTGRHVSHYTTGPYLGIGGERGIWTLAPVSRPTPLAGAPLRPLEYFSIRIYLYIYLNPNAMSIMQ